MNRRQRQRGAATLEFGLAFLLFFTFIMAIMEFGRIVSAYNILAGATREATRYATVHGSASGSPATDTDIQNIVRRWAVGLDANAVQVTTTWSPGNAPGNRVRVQARYTISPITNLVVSNGIPMQSTSELVISQ